MTSASPAPISSADAPVPRPRPSWPGRIGLLASLVLCPASWACYGARPDACAAVTVFPAWVWPIPGLILAAIGWGKPTRLAASVVVLAWVAFLMAVADEPRSLLRAIPRPWAPSMPEGLSLRVVSLNCNVGDVKAAEEVIAYRPDLVLLQESPNRAEVERLAHRLFGDEAGFVHGVDASLIARGPIVAIDLPSASRGFFVEACVRLSNGREIAVLSTRLRPAVFRLDLWSPECWAEQAEDRRARREQVRAVARRVADSKIPVIVGGDFNAPQGDGAFGPLRPKLRDAFDEAGEGWGNTILNDIPALRIDQVWASREFQARRVVARKTRHSDHRMVVCDLILRASPSPEPR